MKRFPLLSSTMLQIVVLAIILPALAFSEQAILDDFVLLLSFGGKGFSCSRFRAEMVLADFEACLGAFALSDCAIQPNFIALGTPSCRNGGGVAFSGGLFSFSNPVTTGEQLDAAACVQNAAESTICVETLQLNFAQLETISYVRDTPTPTGSPTTEPTSLKPSSAPSLIHSYAPSLVPTMFPTRAPSNWPSSKPSVFPTVSQSATPTVKRSEFPTDPPSIAAPIESFPPSLLISMQPSMALVYPSESSSATDSPQVTDQPSNQGNDPNSISRGADQTSSPTTGIAAGGGAFFLLFMAAGFFVRQRGRARSSKSFIENSHVEKGGHLPPNLTMDLGYDDDDNVRETTTELSPARSQKMPSAGLGASDGLNPDSYDDESSSHSTTTGGIGDMLVSSTEQAFNTFPSLNKDTVSFDEDVEEQANPTNIPSFLTSKTKGYQEKTPVCNDQHQLQPIGLSTGNLPLTTIDNSTPSSEQPFEEPTTTALSRLGRLLASSPQRFLPSGHVMHDDGSQTVDCTVPTYMDSVATGDYDRLSSNGSVSSSILGVEGISATSSASVVGGPLPRSEVRNGTREAGPNRKNLCKSISPTRTKKPLLMALHPFPYANMSTPDRKRRVSRNKDSETHDHGHESDNSSNQGEATDYEPDRAWDPDDSSVASTDVGDAFQPTGGSVSSQNDSAVLLDSFRKRQRRLKMDALTIPPNLHRKTNPDEAASTTSRTRSGTARAFLLPTI